MQKIKTPRTAVFVFLLATVVIGNEVGPPPPFSPPPPTGSNPDPNPTVRQQFPGHLRDAVFGKTLAGEFTGDDSLDAVVMDGTVPKLLISPEIYDTAIPVQFEGIPVTANDIAVLEGAGVNKDLLLTVGTGGLQRWERMSNSWSLTTIRGLETPWKDATHVRVGDIDGQDGRDIVGIGLDNVSGLPTRVLVELNDGAGGYVSSAFSCFGNAYDVQVLDWDGGTGDGSDETDEVAVITSLGVEVFELDGTQLQFFSWPYSTIYSAVIDHSVLTAERLALVTDSGAPNHFLLVFGKGGLESTVPIGTPGVVNVVSADMDEDGDADLLLSITDKKQFWVLDNLSPAAPGTSSVTFDGVIDKRSFGIARDTSGNLAGIATGDFDFDGHIDVLPPAQGDGVVASEALVYHWDWANDPSYLPVVDSDPDYDEVAQELELEFSYPAAELPGVVGGSYGIELTVWRTSNLGVDSDTAAYADTVFTGATYTLELPALYDANQGTEVFSLVARVVALDPAENILQRGPAVTALILPIPHWNAVMFAPDVLNANTIGTSHGEDDPTQIGIGPRPPTFEEGEEPGRGGT